MTISPASFAQEFTAWFGERRMSKSALAAKVGTNRVSIRFWLTGRAFPRDEYCEKLYTLTGLNCFGPGRNEARAEHERLIPAAVIKNRRSKYRANLELFRGRARASWRKRYEGQRQFVSTEELDTLRKDPRKKKNVCRVCGEVLLDVGPHLAPSHDDMEIADYKEKWGFNRSRNATRSESTNEKQSAAMRRIRHKPPKWTQKLLSRAQEASLLTNQPGSARLEERLNARGKRLAARPQHWKRTASGEIVTDTRIAQLRLRGKSVVEIAATLGMWPAPVWNRLERMGFPRRGRVFVHGEPVTAKHFLALISDFSLTVEQAAQLSGISVDWARRVVRGKALASLSPRVAKRILKARHELTKEFRRKPAAGKLGGRPKRLTLGDELEVPKKYGDLRAELKSLRVWIHEQDRAPSNGDIWDKLCAQFRSEALRALQFWPQFFAWIEKKYDARAFRQGSWAPHDIAVGFLAADYGASESVIAHVLSHQPA